MKVLTMKVKFHGLYYWGSGWKDVETKDRWHYFWSNINGNFWSYFRRGEGNLASDHLVGTDGSIFLHPMGFDVVIKKIGKSGGYDENGNFVETFNQLEELKRWCKTCADMCGGDVSFGEVKVHEIDY